MLMRGIRIEILYKLLGRIDASSCHHTIFPEPKEISSCIFDLTMLWHRRLGHINEMGLRSMHNKGMVDGFLNYSSEIDFCEHCVYGKQNCVSSPTRDTR